MPVILSDATWMRIEKMLTDYESGVLRVIPGDGLKIDEQRTVKANCPGTKMSVDVTSSDKAFPSLNVNVCIDGSPVEKNFLIKI